MSENTTKIDYRPALERYVKGQLLSHTTMNIKPLVVGDTFNHIVNIGVSILETKFPEIGPGYPGGSFVQAVVDNDLMLAIGKADNINKNYLDFYCSLLYNFSPHQLEN